MDFDKKKYDELIQAYNKAVKDEVGIFNFYGEELLTRYAGLLIGSPKFQDIK